MISYIEYWMQLFVIQVAWDSKCTGLVRSALSTSFLTLFNI